MPKRIITINMSHIHLFLRHVSHCFKMLFLLGCIAFILVGCNKDDMDDNMSPRTFRTTVEGISVSGIVVRWTESTDPENSIVKYRVYIAEDIAGAELELIADNISETQFPDKNREFFFFHNIFDLKHNTQYKGKVVAFDQDGKETEIPFSAKTVEDTFVPVINEINTQAYKNSIDIKIEIENPPMDYFGGQMTANLYLDGNLISDALSYNFDTDDYKTTFEGELTALNENTSYDVKVLISAANNSTETEFVVTTAGDTYEGNLEFRYQHEIDEFSQNQFKKIIGDIRIIVPNGCHPEDPYNDCANDITDLLDFNTILEIDGNITLATSETNADFLDTGSPLTGGLAGLELVTGNVTIHKTDLSNLFGKINSIGGDLKITRSSGFNNLNMFSDVDFVGGNIEINSCSDLGDFCGLQSVIANGFSGTYEVMGNEYNPTLDDIINNNCKQ